MRGSVTKRGKTWTYILPLGRDPATGRQRQKWVGGFATKRAAEEARTAALERVRLGTYVDPGATTVAQFLNRWLAAVGPVGVAPRPCPGRDGYTNRRCRRFGSAAASRAIMR
jgi:hypothetical protein